MQQASPRPFALFLLNFFYVFIQVNKSGTFALHKVALFKDTAVSGRYRCVLYYFSFP